MKQPKIFQIVVIAIFAILIILGFLGFSGKLPLPTSKSDVSYGEVTLWGSIPAATMQTLISNTIRGDRTVTIKYVEKNKNTLESDFIQALASGKGPDLLLLPQDGIVKDLDKFSIIPYQSISERDFKNTFIQEGEMYLRPEGILGLPFTIDPIVMYWNRDIFTSALFSAPPTLWSQFYDLVPKITIKDSSGNITRSLVSFGEYRNVSHAKEIVSTLMMQAGSSIVQNTNGTLTSALVTSGNLSTENPVVTAMRFYTEFSKSNKDSYSWNRSLPESRSMFVAGDLSLYFGYASEFDDIKLSNPHLNFDVAIIPQVGVTSTKLTFGRMQALAIVAASKKPEGAFYAASVLSGKAVISEISSLLKLPPVRRDLISLRATDATQSVFYDSALISRAWFDPAPTDTDSLFLTMFDNVTSGRNSMAEALSAADSTLGKLLHSYY